MKIGFDVAQDAGQFSVGGQDCFGRLALLHHLLSFFLILPEIRFGYFLFDFGEGLPAVVEVKDNSARVRFACEVLPAAALNLR
jgi:hypothetical protein